MAASYLSLSLVDGEETMYAVVEAVGGSLFWLWPWKDSVYAGNMCKSTEQNGLKAAVSLVSAAKANPICHLPFQNQPLEKTRWRAKV